MDTSENTPGPQHGAGSIGFFVSIDPDGAHEKHLFHPTLNGAVRLAMLALTDWWNEQTNGPPFTVGEVYIKGAYEYFVQHPEFVYTIYEIDTNHQVNVIPGYLMEEALRTPTLGVPPITNE